MKNILFSFHMQCIYLHLRKITDQNPQFSSRVIYLHMDGDKDYLMKYVKDDPGKPLH